MSPTSLNRDNGLQAQNGAGTSGERPSRTAPHLGPLPLQQLRRVQEETLDSPARNAASAPSTHFATAGESSRRAGRPPSADTALTRSAARQKYGYRAVGTDLAHSRQSCHKPIHTPNCLDAVVHCGSGRDAQDVDHDVDPVEGEEFLVTTTGCTGVASSPPLVLRCEDPNHPRQVGRTCSHTLAGS